MENGNVADSASFSLVEGNVGGAITGDKDTGGVGNRVATSSAGGGVGGGRSAMLEEDSIHGGGGDTRMGGALGSVP
jgi:hypothetical protein